MGRRYVLIDSNPEAVRVMRDGSATVAQDRGGEPRRGAAGA